MWLPVAFTKQVIPRQLRAETQRHRPVVAAQNQDVDGAALTYGRSASNSCGLREECRAKELASRRLRVDRGRLFFVVYAEEPLECAWSALRMQPKFAASPQARRRGGHKRDERERGRVGEGRDARRAWARGGWAWEEGERKKGKGWECTWPRKAGSKGGVRQAHTSARDSSMNIRMRHKEATRTVANTVHVKRRREGVFCM
jgi:hypothetical protein